MNVLLYYELFLIIFSTCTRFFSSLKIIRMLLGMLLVKILNKKILFETGKRYNIVISTAKLGY